MADSKLIQKFLEGKTTEAETKEVLNYLAGEDADLTDLRIYMESQWDPKKSALIPSGLDQNMLMKLRERLYPDVQHKDAPALKNRSWIRYAAAACMIPLLMVGTYFLYRGHFSGEPIAKNEVRWETFRNMGTKTDRHRLPDGTSVWLASNSVLSFSAEFTRGHRDVRLEGEAFFDVYHDMEHPFVIMTNGISTRVLGTAFNVEAYADEKDVRISLVNGKVAVQKETPDGGAARFMNPGEMLSWGRQSNMVRRDTFKVVDADEWTKGYMIFNDVLLTDALRRIAQRYHMTVQYDPGIPEAEKRITTLLRDNPVDELLHILPFITPYRYAIKNQVLVVEKK